MNRRQIASILCLLLAFAPAAHAWTPFGGGYKQQVKAENIETDTTNFNGACSSTDTTVQACMDQLDDAVSGGFTSATITGKTLVTAASGDNLIIADASDGYNLKKVDAADFLAAGSGDVTAVGDCATGACFTGSSGTALTFKNATSGTVALQTVAGALGTRTISLPAETGTVCTTGSVCSGYQAAGSYLTAEVDGSTTNEIQNLFETFNASSGTDPVADSATDTLNISGGTGITVTGDSSTDTLTIASTVVDTDTNASTICAGTTTYLDGEGNCDDISSVYEAADASIIKSGEIDTSSEIAGIVSDETGTGALVFGTSPTLTTPNLGTPSAITLTNASGLPTSALPSNQIIRSFGITVDGGGSAITTGQKGYVQVPFACTIVSNTVMLDQSGSIVFDVWKDTYANYPPTVADTITASAKPTVSSATKSTDSTLTGWTTSVSAGDVIGFNVDSVTTATRATLVIKCNAT